MAGPATSEAGTPQTPPVVDAAEIYASDAFRMTAFKTLLCSNRQPHDWKRCPFAHPGEHARRRPLDKHSYCAEMCPHARHSLPCPRGDACPFSHHVFEMWLHPDRYKTTLCVDGAACKRRVCFFAHKVEELRTPSFGGCGVDHAAAAQQLALLSPNLAAGLPPGNGGGGALASSAAPAQPLLRRAPCVVPAPQGSSDGGDSSRGAGSPVPASHHALRLPSPALASATAAPAESAAALQTAMLQGDAAAARAGFAAGQAASAAACQATAIGVTPAADGTQVGMLGGNLLSQAQAATAADACLTPACPARPGGLGQSLLTDAVAVSTAADAGFVLSRAFSGAVSGPLLSMQEQGTFGLGPPAQSLPTWEVVSLSAPLLQQLPLLHVQQMPLRVASLNAQHGNTCTMLPLLSGGSIHPSAAAAGSWPGAVAPPSAAGPTVLIYTAAPVALQQLPPQQLQTTAGAHPVVIYTHPSGAGQ